MNNHSQINLFTSNRLEILSEKLAEVLRQPLASPLQQEIILVQSKGMERWVSMELARHNGICANCRFPFPNRFVYDVFRGIIPDLEETSPFTPEIMTWKVMEALPLHLKKKGFAALRNYLSEGAADLKLFQLSQRIADLCDQYLLFRPEMVLSWEKGEDDRWQAILWRELVKGNEQKHRAALQKIFLEAIKKPEVKLETLPERIAVFGISALPPFHVEVLAAIARLIEVNLFLLNPCREYWGDLLTRWETRKVQEKERKKGSRREDLHLEKGNSLLASTGMLGRDFFELISNYQAGEKEFFIDPGENILLSCIQGDILNLREGSPGEGGKKEIGRQDDSIQVYSCHSPMREVEALQDRLLSLFESDPTLLPKDILVMTPDMETYSPFIQAVFSVPHDDPRWIPFSIADRGVRQESQLADTFLSLLDLPGSRFTTSQVMAVLENQSLQRRFSISGGDLERIHRWIRDTRIRWGIDKESRKDLGLPEFPENTWRAGLERMLLGYAMPGQGEKMFKGILPYDEIEGSDAAVLGHFVALAERLFALEKELGEQRTLEEWEEFLARILDDFFLPDKDTERDILFIRRVLRALGEKQGLAGFDEKVSWGVIKSNLRSSLEKEGFGYGFLAGGITFCAILPMRSIPFRVICLLGLNDDSYPRQTQSLGFDLMAGKPRPGDRSRRNDDRYLFLEAILSAREKLHISYVGQSIQDNSIRPPSVLVSELLDYIEEGFEAPGKKVVEQIVFRHRLQAFSPEYFKKSGNLFSYSRENFDAAKHALNPRKEGKPFFTQGLPAPPEEWKTVEVSQLSRFLGNPARFLLNQRLGIYLEEEEVLFEEVEPFEVKGLKRYQLEMELFERRFEKRNLKEVFEAIKASGQLPHGIPGKCFYQEACQEVETFVARLAPYLEGAVLEPLDADLPIGEFRLRGRIEGIYPMGLLHFRYTQVKPRDRLRIWINLLVLNEVGNQAYPGNAILVCKDAGCQYPAVEKSKDLLEALLEIYWQGLREPAHFFPASSFAYAEALSRGKDPDQALEAARRKWEGSDFNLGESEDLNYRLCFEYADPLDEDFARLSKTVFAPLLRCEEKIKSV
jgi:exodeoxyribonuclease V gamma subunit